MTVTPSAGTVPVTIYTASGELEDNQPPSMSTGCVYRNRIYAVDNTGLAVWYTKRLDQNPGIAPGWNPQLRLLFDQQVTGLAVLDDRLIIFTATGIYVYASDGPELTGDFAAGESLPNKLQTSVGCTNPRSIVSGIDGVYFESDGRLYMLLRELSVEWVGKPAKDLISANPGITSAVLVQDYNHIRWTTSTGVTIVYDYSEKQWSHFVYVGGKNIVDACMHGGVYTFVTSDGIVYKETAGYYLDDGAYISSQIETEEVSSAGPIAYHNVRRFRLDGSSLADHTLTLDAAFNGSTTWDQTVTFPSGTANVTAPGPIENASFTMGIKRKCRTVRYRITDTAPTGFDGTQLGQGFYLSSMGIEFGVNKGFGRVQASQRM